MAARRGRKPTPTVKPGIHLVLRSHPPGEPFLRKRIPEGTRSIVIENTSRVWGRDPLQPNDFYKTGMRHDSTQAKAVKTAHGRGIPTFVGESIPNPPNTDGMHSRNPIRRWLERRRWRKQDAAKWKVINHYQQLQEENHQQFEVAFGHPSVENIRSFFEASAQRIDFREQLVVDTLVSAPKPTVARYGSGHGRISELLRKRGIASTREIEEQVFAWDLIVERKILAGKKPTNREFMLGFINLMLEQTQTIRQIIGKKTKPLTDKDVRFAGAAVFALLSQVKEGDIPELMGQRNNPALVYQTLIRLNRLPLTPTREEWEAFIQKNVYVYHRKHELVKK